MLAMEAEALGSGGNRVEVTYSPQRGVTWAPHFEGLRLFLPLSGPSALSCKAKGWRDLPVSAQLQSSPGLLFSSGSMPAKLTADRMLMLTISQDTFSEVFYLMGSEN